MDLLDRIDRQIDAKHLLHHPFYTKWNEGTLPREALREYARQYYAFESSFPRFLSALHSRTEDAAVRQTLLDNLWDEEHGLDNHAEMWLQFAEGIGVARDDVKSAPRNPATQHLVDLYREVTTERPVAEGVAALYAYERQVPEVAQSKIEGLKRHYWNPGWRRAAIFPLSCMASWTWSIRATSGTCWVSWWSMPMQTRSVQRQTARSTPGGTS